MCRSIPRLEMTCNENFNPGQKVIWANLPPKFGLGGPTLAAKIGPAQPKMVQSIKFMPFAACSYIVCNCAHSKTKLLITKLL